MPQAVFKAHQSLASTTTGRLESAVHKACSDCLQGVHTNCRPCCTVTVSLLDCCNACSPCAMSFSLKTLLTTCMQAKGQTELQRGMTTHYC